MLLTLPSKLTGRLILAVPLLGGMCREVARDPERALLPFLINLLMGVALASWIFGPVIIMALALTLAPVMLATIMLASADFGRAL
ncbi:MAG: hypothetical protein CMH94_08770 [Oceanicaulis sp.]|nr:hypothetical protein [Oceanicaulis sp.]MAZ91395.1 hypothetical protein [Maricaulis sp.]MBI75679.1 hypothetical protein [Oceanicaulis sp.]|tara:strand:- start:452 stop:706 length:255 start_codon:yes stop_codon:yes gene_type:complete